MAEGLGTLYDLAGTALSLLGPSGRIDRYRILKRSTKGFDVMLKTLNDCDIFLDKDSLQRLGLLKRKYSLYANYMGMFNSQAVLAKWGTRHVLRALLAKTAMSVGTKVMDNINDELQSAEEAYRCVSKLGPALRTGRVEFESRPSRRGWTDRAVNSALEITSWSGNILESLRDSARFTYAIYCDDVSRWVSGQQDSFIHRSKLVTLDDYLAKVLEKGTGSLWAAPDLVAWESQVGGFDSELRKKALSIRAHCDYVIKSCLLYDDVADFYYDMETDSVNALKILAHERGMIGENYRESERLHELYRRLYREGIVDEVVGMGDSLLSRAMSMLENISYDDPVIDRRTIEYGSYLLRLFNLRKVLVRDKNIHAIKVCFAKPSSEEAVNVGTQLIPLIANEIHSSSPMERISDLGDMKTIKDNVHEDVEIAGEPTEMIINLTGEDRITTEGLAREDRTVIDSDTYGLTSKDNDVILKNTVKISNG